MSTCADLRDDLTGFAHGLLDDVRTDVVARHVAACADCAAEADAVRALLGLIRDTTEIEPTADETAALLSAVDAELDAVDPEVASTGAPVLHHAGLRQSVLGRTWEQALWRYEHSSRFRRVTLASIGVHAAAAAVVGWLLIGGGDRLRDPSVAIEFGDEVADLRDFDPFDSLADAEGVRRRTDADEPVVAGDQLPFEKASPDGVLLPPIFPRAGSLRGSSEELRAPTVSILLRLSAAVDDGTRDRRVISRLGEALAPRADEAVGDGLAWLATRRGDDGRWGTAPDGEASDVRDGVTAAAVLAFVQNGHSAKDGTYAELLAPAVAALEARLRDGPAKGDAKPVYSHVLAIRALTWQWALDYRRLDDTAREERRKLLVDAGKALVRWQDPATGGFGYRPASDAAAGARPDASCTIFAVGALSDLRLAGVLRADETLEHAGRFLTALRGDEGIQSYRAAGDRMDDPALTAAVLAYARDLRVRGDLRPQIDAVRVALEKLQTPDSLLAWQGFDALRKHASVAPAVARFIDRQRDDGSWASATDRHCRLGGDDLTTAMGVLAVSRVYMP